MYKRARRVALISLMVLTVGLAYAGLVLWTGGGIPCPFHALTGLYCPGCGISRMLLALLQLDIEGAWRAHPLALAALPAGALLAGTLAARYIRRGDASLSRWQNVLVWVLVAAFLLFGVLRNLPGFAVLQPH